LDGTWCAGANYPATWRRGCGRGTIDSRSTTRTAQAYWHEYWHTRGRSKAGRGQCEVRVWVCRYGRWIWGKAWRRSGGTGSIRLYTHGGDGETSTAQILTRKHGRESTLSAVNHSSRGCGQTRSLRRASPEAHTHPHTHLPHAQLPRWRSEIPPRHITDSGSHHVRMRPRDAANRAMRAAVPSTHASRIALGSKQAAQAASPAHLRARQGVEGGGPLRSDVGIMPWSDKQGMHGRRSAVGGGGGGRRGRRRAGSAVVVGVCVDA
jgi:hypothetical protein